MNICQGPPVWRRFWGIARKAQLAPLAAGSRAPHLNGAGGWAARSGKKQKAEELTKPPTPGDKDRICFVERWNREEASKVANTVGEILILNIYCE